MTKIHNVSRRDFLKQLGLASSGFVVGFYAAPKWAEASALSGVTTATATALEPNVFVRIPASGKVQLICHRSEMGQGARTTVAMLLAEELDVAWDEIDLIQAVGDPKYGNQNTDGSTTVILNWDTLRQAGAAAREVLIYAGAKAMDVPAAECIAEKGFVVHVGGSKKPFGELVEIAAELPVPTEPRLKSPDAYVYIGKDVPNIDRDEVVMGQVPFGFDVEVPGMVYASIERSPTVRGAIESLDDSAARKVPGVIDVVKLEPLGFPVRLTNASVAVVATNTWAAVQGRKALKVTWKQPDGELEETSALRKKMEAAVQEEGSSFRKEGDAPAADSVARTVEAVYTGPHLAHSPMEPPCATAWVNDDGCQVWAPTQHPQWARGLAAGILGIPQDKVTINVTFLGGGFGRKSKPDFILEAASLSQKIQKPVKVQWTREDEIRHGFYRAQNVQRVKVAVDGDGKPLSWEHHTCFPTIASTFQPGATKAAEFELSQGLTDFPYRVPHLEMRSHPMASDLRIGWLRSVCHTFHAFAVSSMVDELAVTAKRDPIDYTLELLGEPRTIGRGGPYGFDTGRLSNVIRELKSFAPWGKAPEGRKHGFATHHSFRSYIAMVLEASVDAGQAKVHRVWCTVDCGRVLNPDNVKAQIEGSVVFGLSLALYGEITVDGGVVQQSNFHDYPMLRFPDMPQVEVKLIDSERPPSGMGEPGVPPVAPALTNALRAVTGKRITDLPVRL